MLTLKIIGRETVGGRKSTNGRTKDTSSVSPHTAMWAATEDVV